MSETHQPQLDHSIRSFLESASAAKPTPGGGSIAALVGALGASMAAMAANFSTGARFSSISEQVDDALRRLQQTDRDCEDLLEADIVSFERYMTAMKLPQVTEEQKEIRKQAILTASMEAVSIPLRLMEVCLEALRVTEVLAPLANKNVISDLGIGALLFEASAQSALLTVDINLAAMQASELRSEYERKSEGLISDIVRLKDNIVQQVRQRIMQ
ncbi:MAG: methenyltetrahydrofolate cyclohydrolase [Paenibacillus sp.]|nr:methenyltetrahydrofolate cyclohydrolase [Paenibacillus sp.]